MRTLSTNLTNEMNSLARRPYSKVTVEPWLPKWQPALTGLSTSRYEQYAHGHAAIVVKDGSDNDVLVRLRSGRFDNPRDECTYLAIIKGADLANPAGWESKWQLIDTIGAYPAWAANTGIQYGASVALAPWGSGVRAFFYRYGSLVYRDYDLDFNLTASGFVIGILGTDSTIMASLQWTAVDGDLYLLRTDLVEPAVSSASWHKPIYGSQVIRYYWTGSAYQVDNAFPFLYHTHAEAACLRDGQLAYGGNGTGKDGQAWGDGSANQIQTQWGKRPCGGLAVHRIDSATIAISAGFTYWRRWGYNTHSQGLMSFLFHADSGVWERGFETGNSDFTDGQRLELDVFARGSAVEGNNILVWNRNYEPANYDQVDDRQSIPRTRETVYALLSADGKMLTSPQYLGPQDDLTAAAIVAITYGGQKKLYAIGWRSIYQSEPAALLCNVPDGQKLNLEKHAVSWRVSRNNRWGMNISIVLKDPAAAFGQDSLLRDGNLVRVYHGNQTGIIQIAQGYLDVTSPAVYVQGQQIAAGAQLVARADKPLLDTKAETIEDILPQNTMYVRPEMQIKNIAYHAGFWQTAIGTWDHHFFGGQYGMTTHPVFRLKSFPWAQTGGLPEDLVSGNPGNCLNWRPQYKGTWFKDIVWLAMSPMVDGSIQASVRFGDVYNWQESGAPFYGAYELQTEQVGSGGNIIYGDVKRGTLDGHSFPGMITQIKWDVRRPNGTWEYSVFGRNAEGRDPCQAACMAGLICHALDVDRKYMFVWEAYSDLSKSSHTNDTWYAEDFDRADYETYGLGRGYNRLYLIVADKSGNNYINTGMRTCVAAGITPGAPAQLKMQVLGGTLYCWYRPYPPANTQAGAWRFAFSYKTGRFGAARFGIAGRGHAGIQYDMLADRGFSKVALLDNYVDFWDIRLSDNVQDRPLEYPIKKFLWQGFTQAQFDNRVYSASQTISAGNYLRYTESPLQNPLIDFKLQIESSGGEAGVILRGVDFNAPYKHCVKIGITAGNDSNFAPGNPLSCQVVKRLFITNPDGSYYEETDGFDYSPIPLQIYPQLDQAGQSRGDWPWVPVRITARNHIYSVWIGGNYAGHFIDDTELGVWAGLYATGATARFKDVRVLDLYEVPNFATCDVNQSMLDVVKGVIGSRRIKGVYTYDGQLKVGYFSSHPSGPTFDNSLTSSAYQRSDRFYSVIKVEGAYTYAVYTSAELLKKGRRFHLAHNPDIFHQEFCYREAQAIMAEIAERMIQATFTGLPDLRLDPEDSITVSVEMQELSGEFLVDDVTIDFNIEAPDTKMAISTRQKAVI